MSAKAKPKPALTVPPVSPGQPGDSSGDGSQSPDVVAPSGRPDQPRALPVRSRWKEQGSVFYWLVGEASGEAWLSGRVGVQNDDCIVFNAWSSNRAGVNRFVLVAVRRDARLPAGLLHALLQGRRDQAIAHERQ
jgi:hypothetical protein